MLARHRDSHFLPPRLPRYVDTNGANRTSRAVQADKNTYLSLYQGLIDGIFFDRVSTSSSHIDYYGGLAFGSRNTGHKVIFNFGDSPYSEYMNFCDLCIVFQGTACAYRTWVPKEADFIPSKIGHMIHGVTSPGEMREVLALARKRNAGVVHVTHNAGPAPWGSLPSYLDAELEEMSKDCDRAAWMP